MVGSELGVKNMKAWIHPVSMSQAAGGDVMVWGIFYWHTLSPLVPNEHRLNTKAYLSIVADHVHPFKSTVYTSSDGYFQQVNAPCHKAQIISDWFLEHDKWVHFTQKASTVTRSQSNRAPLGCGGMGECIMDVQPTNLQQLRDAIMSIWTKISEECFQHLVESMPQSIKAVLKAKGGPLTRYIYIYQKNWKLSQALYERVSCH